MSEEEHLRNSGLPLALLKLLAFVVGGKGIGAVVVERLCKDGYAVVTGSRSAVPGQGEDLTEVRAELAGPEGVEALAAAALEPGRVDALVHDVEQFDAGGSSLDSVPQRIATTLTAFATRFDTPAGKFRPGTHHP
jgi:NAD(P)-dependent dehydrogenase (short-subunit alcohol dehydrogenase family)